MKQKIINIRYFTNPFLTEDREELWKKLEEGAKPISKEEVFRRARETKEQSHKNEK
ncbi:hypothetical protein RCC89_16475 [Cytophagaceae bacterium ABcell3]|nr:hypothetical protein RCC89_16475 [Cytophagaceae bacterium ABcell3]